MNTTIIWTIVAVVAVIVATPWIARLCGNYKLDRDASNIVHMRKQLEKQKARRLRAELKRTANNYKNQIRECAKELRVRGESCTKEEYISRWFKAKGYDVTHESAFSSTYWKIVVPSITIKELSDIIVK